MVKIEMVYEFKFCVSGNFGLEVTNRPGTAKVMGSNLIGPLLLKRNLFCFKKISTYYLCAEVFSA